MHASLPNVGPSPSPVASGPPTSTEVIRLGETTVGRSHWSPGWRWSVDLAVTMATESCQVHHLGHSIPGVLHVLTDDGESLGDEPWVTLEWTSAHLVGMGPESAGERIVATVLFTDIVDSTAMVDSVWMDLLRRHNLSLREDLNSFRGREVSTTGDEFLAVFDGASRAVRCAMAMTRSAEDLGLRIRVAIHTGEIDFVAGDVRGIAVHTAARMMSLAGASEVVVSSTTRDLIEGSGLVLEDAGVHELKGLPGPRPAFRVVRQRGAASSA